MPQAGHAATWGDIPQQQSVLGAADEAARPETIRRCGILDIPPDGVEVAPVLPGASR
ncbi:hypothetical protein ACFUKV_34480 [Streptomyces paradoxus]|uniref:hypothetical protein n=1 Tax=Streptomyces paradoxus TaxID=66375 RepID=UPI003634A32E